MFVIKAMLNLITEMLGTQPSQEELLETYVKSKAPDPSTENDAELPDAEELADQHTTVFLRDKDGNLVLRDYQIKGFLKSRGEAIRQRIYAEHGQGSKERKPWVGIKGKIDDHVFVYPRVIPIMRDGKPLKKSDRINERTLRIMHKGVAVTTIASSEEVFAGSCVCVEIKGRGVVTEDQIRQMLDEGEFFGLGQWRNAGHGRFEWHDYEEIA